MRKIYIVFFLSIFLTSSCLAQSYKENKKEADRIKCDTSYFWAESGVCASQTEAVEKALENLYSNIASSISADPVYLPNGGSPEMQMVNIVKTFNINEKASNFEMLPILENLDDNEYNNVVIMKKSVFRNLCKRREEYINKYIENGMKAQQCFNYSLALKSYYWGLMLCYAHPDGNKLLREDEELGKISVIQYLEEKIDGEEGILKSIRFIIPKEKESIEMNDDGPLVTLKVTTTAGETINELRFFFNDGRNARSTNALNGMAKVQLMDKDKTYFTVTVDYAFKDEAKGMAPEVYKAITLIKNPVKFSKLTHRIDLQKVYDEIQPKKSEKELAESAEDKAEAERLAASLKADDPDLLKNIKAIEHHLRNRDYAALKPYFTKEGCNMLDSLMKYGKMTVAGRPDYQFIAYNDEVICRSIPIQFDFENNVGFYRDVVFRFDAESKKVTSLAFRLSDIAENDIVSKSKWPAMSRMALINFLEDYQTAYAMKRLNYLNQIYSENAVIIVGSVLKNTKIADQMKLNVPETTIKLIRKDKTEYMSHLAKAFKANNYINIRFAETIFNKMPNAEIYGIGVKQEYYSSTYGDVGYLFLAVDLRGELPVIHVRAWQPDDTNLSDLVNLRDLDYRITK